MKGLGFGPLPLLRAGPIDADIAGELADRGINALEGVERRVSWYEERRAEWTRRRTPPSVLRACNSLTIWDGRSILTLAWTRRSS
jgi:hypothetical protein